jgi:hypothetical protein
LLAAQGSFANVVKKRLQALPNPHYAGYPCGTRFVRAVGKLQCRFI